MNWSRCLHVAIAAGLVVGACTSKREVMVSPPLFDRVVEGRINVVGPCVHNEIQLYDYSIAPTVQYIPGEDFVEIQTIASSGFTGTIYGQVTRPETVSEIP